MNENLKTVIFVGVAGLVVLAAWLSGPAASKTETGDLRGKPLVDEFDPLSIGNLEIVEFDKDTASIRPFAVAKVAVKGKTTWSIPSHENYPTDAKDQLSDVAAGLMGLKILNVASDSPGDHARYGVLDPDPKRRKGGDTGVGTRVTMKDDQGKELLSLVIGEAVKDKPDLRYVRRVGDDHVYVVALKTDKISTKFDRWIEKDLLKLSTWDIKQLWVRDHAVDEVNAELLQRGELTLEYNDTGEPKWKMLKDERFDEGKWVPVPLADDEELNVAKLDEMKTALGDLKIVDVESKPKGVSADLKAQEDLAANPATRRALAENGFWFAKIPGKQVELFSNEGEVRVLMKDGVEYILRFGNIAPDLTGATTNKEDKEAGKDKEADKDKEKKSGPGVNRYLFVTTEFNPAAIAKPQLEPLPGEEKPAAEGQKPGEEKRKPAEGDKAAEGKTAETKPAAADAPKPEAKTEPKAEEKKVSDAKADEKKADEKKPDEKQADDKKPDAKPEENKDAKKSDAKAERERIEKENKRKQDEYDEKKKKGQDRVKELNNRFADWYYVISDEVYKKIHLNRGDIVKKKEKPKDDAKDKAKDGEGHDHGPGEGKPTDDNPLRDSDPTKDAGPEASNKP